ncbi:hypothetical protein DVH24_038052 [Malus domestica]|uniref:Uncharacterized protein n=1 Tax=Malus domestica TaxID=3750 RepID=A0A498K8M6_MALDO|nr:hypothetical protein DVH24_038052 [Malus domestica]
MKYYIASGCQCIQAFLQQLLNKIFISALDNDLDLVTIIVPADQPPPPVLLPATLGLGSTTGRRLSWPIACQRPLEWLSFHPTSLQTAPSNILLSRSRNPTCLCLYRGSKIIQHSQLSVDNNSFLLLFRGLLWSHCLVHFCQNPISSLVQTYGLYLIYVASGLVCLKAFLQQQLNKIFISPPLDDDLDPEEVPIPAEPAAGSSWTGKAQLRLGKDHRGV